MSSNHYYTPIDLQALFSYIISKIDFTVEGLSTDTGCSIVFYPPKEQRSEKQSEEIKESDPDFYEKHEKKFISETFLKIKQENFENKYNSHDWIKIYKHTFQHTEFVNMKNEKIMQSWYYFSNYFRMGCKNELITPEEYNIQLKHFISMLIFHGAELEAKCIHQFLHLAFKIQSNERTMIDSKKVANMLGGIFYNALKIEGIHRPFKLNDLNHDHQLSYVGNIKKTSKVLKYIIEDPFFEQDFNKYQYTEFLIIGEISPRSPQESPRIKVISSDDRLPDESFIRKFKLNSSCNEETTEELLIEKMKGLNLSRRRSEADKYSREDSSVKGSFSDGSLLKRSQRINLYDERSLSPERNDKMARSDSIDLKRKGLSSSCSPRIKGDKLEKKRSQYFNVYRKSDGERNVELENINAKAQLFSIDSTTSSKFSLNDERRSRNKNIESSLSPEMAKRKQFLSKKSSLSSIFDKKNLDLPKETTPSPETGKRILRINSEDNLSPDSQKNKLNSSKEISFSPEIERRKSLSSKERSLSPIKERTTLRKSKETSRSPDQGRRKTLLSKYASSSPEVERRDLIFSSESNSGSTTPEPMKRVVLEENKEPLNKTIFK